MRSLAIGAALCLSSAVLIAPVEVCSQDLPSYVDNVPERGMDYGLPYASGSDEQFLSAKVERACVDGTPLGREPSHYFFVAAHHSDYPLRPAGFAASNFAFAPGPLSGYPGYMGEGKVVAGEQSFPFHANGFFVSAMMYAVFPGAQAGDPVTIMPVAPGLTAKLADLSSGPARLKALGSYRFDCGYETATDADGRHTASKPLIRSDFLPSIEISAELSEDKPMLDAALKDAFTAASMGFEVPLSTYFLRASEMEAQWEPWIPDAETYGRFLQTYVENTNASEAKFFPAFLPVNPDGTIRVRIPMKGWQLLIAPPSEVTNTKVAEATPGDSADARQGAGGTADAIKPNRDGTIVADPAPEALNLEVTLVGEAFDEIRDNPLGYELASADGRCLGAAADQTSLPELHFSLDCSDVPNALILLLSGATQPRLYIILRKSAPDDVPGAPIEIDAENVIINRFTVTSNQVDGAKKQLPIVNRTLSNLVGREFQGKDCAERVAATLDDVLRGDIELSDCEPPGADVTVTLPPDLVQAYGAKLGDACLPGSVPFDEASGQATCAVSGAIPRDITVSLGAMYDPIRVPVIRRGDAVTAELTRDAAMQGLSLSEDALTGVEQALAPAAPRDAAPGIVKMEFLVDDQTCERSLQRRTGTLLSPADAGCRRWPAEVAFTVVLSPQTAVPDDVYQAVTLAPVSLRTGGLDQLENPPYHRSIVIDAQAMMEPLGGAAAHISRKAPGWSIALYGTEYCDEPKGAIGPEGEQQDNERQPLDLTWPVYARVNWWEDPYGSPVPMSDCVPITIDGLRKQDGKLDGHFAFDLKRLPDGRGVLVLSISTDVNGGGRRQVLQTALERFGARYADLAAGGDRSMNELELWDMTSTGTVRERARLSQVGDNAAEIRRLFAEEIERGGAPSVPDLGLIEQIVRVSEADAGAVIIIEGRGYDADIERLFARISASSTPLAPDRFWLFLLEGCERWTEFARDEIKQNCTEMQSLTTAELQSRLDTVLLSFLPGE